MRPPTRIKSRSHRKNAQVGRALREMYENLRDDPSAKIILVDRTREKAKLPLCYPDLEAHCKSRARLMITLRDFLIEKTDDQRWPLLVNDRNLSRLLLENRDQALSAFAKRDASLPPAFTS